MLSLRLREVAVMKRVLKNASRKKKKKSADTE
jgi:hypothetical protein